MNSPRPGDIGFSWNSSVLACGIYQFTHAKISHAEIIIDVGVNGTLNTMSAEAEGLIPRWVIPEYQDWYCILRYPLLTLKQIDDICKWLWNHQGEPYDIWGLASWIINVDVNKEEKIFCSESVFSAFEYVGVSLLDGVSHGFVSPRDLYISPVLKTLDGQPKEIR